MFTDLEQSMYARQLILPEIGIAGQELLKNARVLLVGAGGLGCPVLLQLTVAGVGMVGIMDHDVVDVTNLHRQTLYTWDDIGKTKAQCAALTLQKHNPFINLKAIVEKLSFDNVLETISAYDVVVDGTDNFATKYLLNDACLMAQKPLVYGAVSQFDGQVSVFGMPLTKKYAAPSLHHFIPYSENLHMVVNCDTAGVLGVLPTMVGSVQAMEVLKIILKIGESLIGKVLVIDALTMRFQQFALETFPPETTTLKDYSSDTICSTIKNIEISPLELQSKMNDAVPFQLIDVREDWERQICLLPSLHIPLQQLGSRLSEISPAMSVVFYCHHGVRSLHAVAIANENLQGKIYSLAGGIDAWAKEINTSMSRY